MPQTKIEEYLKEQLQNVPIESFVKSLLVEKLIKEEQLSFDEFINTNDNDI
jgi:hypothetical protein